MSRIATYRLGFFVVLAVASMAMFVCLPRTFADAPATQPDAVQTPQQFAATLTNDRLAPMTVDEAMAIFQYDSQSDKEKTCARASAAACVIMNRLELAARKKWGKDAETEVTHALGDTLPADYDKADWAIDGDRAVVQFQQSDLTPLILRKKEGQWKVDLSGYNQLYQNNWNEATKQFQDDEKLFRHLSDELASKDAYPTADVFVQHVKDAMAKLGASN
jgi:hypothetical protein